MIKWIRKNPTVTVMAILVLVIVGCGVGNYFVTKPITKTGLVISSEWQSQWNREVVIFNDGTGIYLANNTPLTQYATYKFILTNNQMSLTAGIYTSNVFFWKLVKETKPADNFTQYKTPILPQEKVQSDYVITGTNQ
jgi:hypothetical protein